MEASVTVVSLQRFRNRELVAVCKELLKQAEAGGMQGLTFVGKFGPRDHRAGLAGDYKKDPAQALSAAVRLERFLAGELPRTFADTE